MNLADLSEREVEAFLEEYDFDEAGYTGWKMVEEYAEAGTETPIGYLELVKQEGGSGQGEHYYMVIRLSQGDVSRTFRMDGWYYSGEGHGFDGQLYEVSPKERTIIVWE